MVIRFLYISCIGQSISFALGGVPHTGHFLDAVPDKSIVLYVP
jgi:hypothetical protein